MKLPFVSRKKYESLQKTLDGIIDSIDCKSIGDIVKGNGMHFSNVTFVNPVVIGQVDAIVGCTFYGRDNGTALYINNLSPVEMDRIFDKDEKTFAGLVRQSTEERT